MPEEFVFAGRDPASAEPLAVHHAGGVITAVRPGPTGATNFIAPGLIDLQVNGYAGHDLNAGRLTPDTVAALADALRRDGVTGFAPTLITAPEDSLLQALAAIAEARQRDPALARAIPFVHLEGPWLDPEDGPRGAHPRAHVRPPNLAAFAGWQEACGGLIGMMTLSPHFPGTPEVVRGLAGMGVHVAIGHTGASPEQVMAAVEAGARFATHLGNGAAQMLPRHPNFLWTLLGEDRVTASFIADGHHLPAATFKTMLRAKGLTRAVLVSDATALAGMPPGIYDQAIGGRVELSADGRLSAVGTPYLAGAALPLAAMVARAVELGGITLAEALGLATVNPGRLLGGRGCLAVGAAADLIRFAWQPGDAALSIETVLVGGEPA